ncbi:MAG: glycosyltransferase family 4 protein [Beijerinckiaceae bacterium]|nr:glycosyltransferase family 4 protein [Beijerinckiaceae bacterium]
MSEDAEIVENLVPGEKIAIVSHSHPSISKGGAEIAAYTLYRGLRGLGVDAIFIAACDHANRGKLVLDSAREHAVFYRGEEYDHFYHLAPADASRQLLKILEDEGVTVVNFHHFIHFGLNALRAVRQRAQWNCFFTLHEFLAMCQHHGQMVTRPAQILCEKATHNSCLACYPEKLYTQFQLRKETILASLGDFDGFISPSHFLARRFVDWGLSAERMSVIENGLVNLHGSTRAIRSGDSWTFGFFGQINPFKGVDVLLDAVERIAAIPQLARRVRFKIHGNIIGQSPEFVARFEKAVARHPFLSYSGPYNNASVHRLMEQCDYVMVPSRWWENSPVVIQEAYAAGSPVICSDVGGMAEKVPHGVSGLNFALGDAADLVRIIDMACDQKRWDGLRSRMPKVLTARDMALRYIDFFEQRLNPGTAALSPAEEVGA